MKQLMKTVKCCYCCIKSFSWTLDIQYFWAWLFCSCSTTFCAALKMGSYAVFLSFALLFICQFQTVCLVSLRKMTLDFSRSTAELAESLSCDACSEMVDVIRKLAELKTSESVIGDVSVELCKKIVAADSSTIDDQICEMIIPEFMVLKNIIYVIWDIFAGRSAVRVWSHCTHYSGNMWHYSQW